MYNYKILLNDDVGYHLSQSSILSSSFYQSFIQHVFDVSSNSSSNSSKTTKANFSKTDLKEQKSVIETQLQVLHENSNVMYQNAINNFETFLFLHNQINVFFFIFCDTY